ncbi:hypothetical protein [Thioalkalivibrio sp. XN279]|uniref:hypothetical protein n=1 Tax=Thioalkalivibrio sp. XN279 TaxID=2714953 RepID=UPI0014097225|nr:hypothetical protein [Thioalkalivibrio sp. XN279]NHA14192.1 hypothetical protein [Thioalkalivibrio sp. XN279]
MSTDHRQHGYLVALAGAALVLALLYWYPLPAMGRGGLAAALLALGWLAYQYLEPMRMLRRRALLSHVTLEASWVRRRLWPGHLLRLRQAVLALATAALALLMAAGLAPYEWAVLLASLASFALLLVLVSRRAARHVVPAYQAAMALRVTFWVNLALAATALALLQVFWLEVPDAGGFAPLEVAAAAFDAERARATLPSVGWLLGLGAAGEAVTWQLLQAARPAEGGLWAYLVAALALLGWNGLKLGSVWVVLLGVVALAQRRRGSAPASQQASDGRGFGLSAVALALLGLLLSRAAPESPPEWLALDPCTFKAPAERRVAAAQAGAGLAAQQAEFNAALEQQLQATLDQAFARAEAGVDSFLDWNFSLQGQYLQLWYLGRSVTGGEPFDEYMARIMDAHVDDALGPLLDTLGPELEAELRARVAAAYEGQAALLQSVLARSECLQPEVPGFALDAGMHKSLVGFGAVGGILATRLGARVGARVMGREAVRRMFAAIATRFGARAAAATQAGQAGALCGPWAPLCAVGIGAAAWVGTDVVLNEIDEALNREEMRAEMLAALAAQRAELETALRAQYLAAASDMFQSFADYQQQVFNPYRGVLPQR